MTRNGGVVDKSLSGIFIPVVTPFMDDEIAYDKLASNIAKSNESSLGGYMVLGSNGEFRSLSDDESEEIIKIAIDVKSKDKTLIVGAGRESLSLAKRFIDRIAKYDIDYLSFLPPHYFKSSMTDTTLVDFYSRIADYSPIPVTMYCAPSFSNGVTISQKAVTELADHPNILGIKDTSSDMMADYCDAVSGRDDFTIMAGSLGNLIMGMARGAKGGVISAANYMPTECCKLFDIVAGGTQGEAAARYVADFFSLYDGTSKKYGVPGVKACMDMNGFSGGECRLPLKALNAGTKAEIKKVFDERMKLLK